MTSRSASRSFGHRTAEDGESETGKAQTKPLNSETEQPMPKRPFVLAHAGTTVYNAPLCVGTSRRF